MTVDDAARTLQKYLAGSPWVNMIGVGLDSSGRHAIYLYVSNTKARELLGLRDGWENFPVIVRKSGSPKPTWP